MPMSRPFSTAPRLPIARCRSTIARRTPGMLETIDDIAVTLFSANLIGHVTAVEQYLQRIRIAFEIDFDLLSQGCNSFFVARRPCSLQ